MATVAAQAPVTARALPGRRYDHLFFSATALLMLLTVFLGFARTYFLAGVFRAPLPSPIIHVHGALFSGWILLLIAQTSLVSAGRVDLHRRLGVAGFVLACFMIVLGVLAATNSLVRAAIPVPGRDPQAFYIVSLSDLLLFAVFFFSAFRLRRNPASHKRLIFFATTALLVAPVARLPISFSYRKPAEAALFTYAFLVLLLAYDWLSTRRIHRVTLGAGVLLVFVQQLRVFIGSTGAWHSFAAWVQVHARWLA